MEKSDYLEVDGNQLKLLLTIQKAGSLSGAAKLLGMNQSTVSYWLDLLRKRFRDPLFVRQGNGVVPTERALELLPAAEDLLGQLQALFETQTYDPARDSGVLRIAGTSVERRRITKPVLAHALLVSPMLKLELTLSNSVQETIDQLVSGQLDMAVMPPMAVQRDGLLQRVLLRTKDVVLFDPAFPLKGGDLDAYCARPHIRIGSGKSAGFNIDKWLARQGRKRDVAVRVSDFDSATELLQGSPLIATLPEIIAHQGVSSVPPPWPQDDLDLALVWHLRNHSSARHKYWREAFVEVSKGNTD